MNSEQFLDIIAIGAVNYDCIFFCDTVRRITGDSQSDEVEEKFSYTREDICRQVDLLRTEAECSISVGGSSFNSIRTAREIDKQIQLGFVGVCGQPGSTEIALGFDPDPRNAFSFLNSTEWLFFDEEAPGLSCVQVVKSDGSRGDIAIVPGANNNLVRHIMDKEAAEGEGSFSDYLSRSKWIHISSLADFDGFLYIVEHLKKAKQKNPLLQISFDPGYLYTKEYKEQLTDMIDLTDFLFLSKGEFNNLTEQEQHPEMDDKALIEALYQRTGSNARRVIVVKEKDHNVLYRYRNNRVKRMKFRHEQLDDARIMNDTGAGDAFAGGFICGNISERMQLHHPVPMELGARAAIARMEELGDPYRNIHSVTNTFLREFENYEFFDDIMQIDGTVPSPSEAAAPASDAVPSETRAGAPSGIAYDLSGVDLLCPDRTSADLLTDALRNVGLSVGPVPTEDERPLIRHLEAFRGSRAVIIVPERDGINISTDPDASFVIGYLAAKAGKGRVILATSAENSLPSALSSFPRILLTAQGWKKNLYDALRAAGYPLNR